MPATRSALLDSYWKDIRHCEPLSRDQEVNLVRRARDGDGEAMRDLIAANVRFVVSVAREFRGTGCPMNELISDGNLGLVEAARRFDETRGFKFITYAVWWIRQSIRRSLSERRGTVVAPSNRVADLKHVERARMKLSQALGRAPTVHEMAQETEFSTRRVNRALEVAIPDVHLDRSLYAEDEETSVASLFESDDPDTDAETQEHETTDLITRCLGTLGTREREIIRRYYGFDDCEPMTLEEIGHTFGLTRERIRQLRDIGLTQLRDRFGDVLFELSHN
ncbi:MAG TPA: RNA polymerase sigma factor RpoD/SigA [Candidatus Latescibacteria bacterium]|nr:RNA polymerase subunit sigma [Gemmatimonadaceae bacterium]MDP6016148.1 RNA polymerase sigma factor RpoD/SigA [Candidatus Latescibacterota bacterium]HJP30046.1 RNA polymerase sigma factor RpoD/SigA [Candidatus Latescibacterota bacterium]